MRRVRAVLFDLDRVLVESKGSTERVWLRWAYDNGIDEDALRSAMHGVRSVEVVRTLRPDLDAGAEGEAIERAQAEDVRDVRAIPGAEGYLRAARRLGVQPGEALVVEDAPPGIEAGRAAGAATVAVTTTHARAELAAADVVIPTLESLPAVLAREFDAAAVLRANDGH